MSQPRGRVPDAVGVVIATVAEAYVRTTGRRARAVGAAAVAALADDGWTITALPPAEQPAPGEISRALGRAVAEGVAAVIATEVQAKLNTTGAMARAIGRTCVATLRGDGWHIRATPSAPEMVTGAGEAA